MTLRERSVAVVAQSPYRGVERNCEFVRRDCQNLAL